MTPLNSIGRRTASQRIRAAIAAFTLLLVFSAHGAESVKKHFDLPAEGAENALKRLANQSGVSVLFATEMTADTRTREVRGEFTALEAANQMLAGTNLVAVQDARTGTLTINRAPTEPAKKNAVGRSPTNETASEGPAAPTSRATVRAVPPRAEVEKAGVAGNDEAQVLSPFVVNSDRDTGYQARTTLAGNRLVSDIRDIGAAVSVYTKDFLNDVGATNAADVLIYAPGMDAAGPQGNYSGAAGDINAVNVTSEVRQQPQASRTRGLAGPNYTRGFFSSRIPLDSYNTGSVTVSRGPNAVLFGAGSPAGVVDTSLLLSDLRRNQAKVETRYGDNDSLRGVLDINRVLLRDRLAFRVIALEDHEKYDQRPAFERKERLYGTVTAKPFRSTTIRANFETGKGRNRSPQTVLPWDSITPWLETGRLIWDPAFYDDPARHPNAAGVSAGSNGATNVVTLNPAFGLNGVIAQGQIFDQIAIIFSQPNARTPDNAFRATLPSVNLGTTSANAVRANLFHPLVNQDATNTTPGTGPSRGDTWAFMATRNLQQMPLLYWQTVTPGATFIPPGLKVQGFTDYRYFDFRHQMLDTTYGQENHFHTFDIAFEQLAWKDRLGVEAVYNAQRYEVDTRNMFLGTVNANFVTIDTTATLPTGQPNPNVGRPMMTSRSSYNRSQSKDENLRITTFARYDFREMSRTLGKWLGRHTLTGLYQKTAQENIGYSYRLTARGEAADAVFSGPIDNSALIPGVVSYIGDSFLNNDSPRFQTVSIPQPSAGLTVPTTYFKAAAGSTSQGDFVVVPTTLAEINATGTASREVLKSQAFALQSHWFDDLLVTTLGWRKDKNYLAQQAVNNTLTENLLPAGHYFSKPPVRNQVHYGFGDFAFPSTPQFRIGREIKSWSVVLRWPQRLVRLPAGSDLSVFYNDSQNFTPAGTRVTAFNEPIEAPRGTTKEMGFNLSFLNDRFLLRLNRYETKVTGQSVSVNNALINGVNSRYQTWTQEANVTRPIDDPRFATASLADAQTLLSAATPNWADLYDLRTGGVAPNIQTTFRAGGIPGNSDTTDYIAKGTEIEFTFNPNRQWRFLANVSKQNTVQTNVAPNTVAFAKRLKPALDALSSRPYNNFPVTNNDGTPYVFGSPLPAGTTTFGQWLETNFDVPLATQLATQGSSSAELPKYRANFVGSYSFATDGRFKGWSIGTGIRWQDKYALGYPVSRDNVDAPIKVDVAHPYWASAQINVDAWVGYQRKIWRDKILWKAQLNVRNLAGDGDPLAITVQPWGAPAVVRLPPEKRWYLTNTFSF